MDVPSANLLEGLSGLEEMSADRFLSLVQDWLEYQITEEEDLRQTSEVIERIVAADRLDLLEIFVKTVRVNYETDEIPGEEDITSPIGDGELPPSVTPYVCCLLSCNLSEDALEALTQVVEIEFFEVVRGLVSVENEILLTAALVNLTTIFPDPAEIDLQAMETLLSIAMSMPGSRILANYLSGLIVLSKRKVAPIPGWILTQEILPTQKQLEKSLPDVPIPAKWISVGLKEDIDKVCEFASQADKQGRIDIAELRKDMEAAWRRSSVLDREEFITGLLVNDKLIDVEYEQDLFRVYGACLPVPNGNTLAKVSRDVCQMRGGCRALTCSHYCNWDPIAERALHDDQSVKLAWFTGRCHVCLSVIAKECYSVRIPMLGGGWSAENFCSFEHARDIEDLDPVQVQMLERIEVAYHTFGIWDRVE